MRRDLDDVPGDADLDRIAGAFEVIDVDDVRLFSVQPPPDHAPLSARVSVAVISPKSGRTAIIKASLPIGYESYSEFALAFIDMARQAAMKLEVDEPPTSPRPSQPTL